MLETGQVLKKIEQLIDHDNHDVQSYANCILILIKD